MIKQKLQELECFISDGNYSSKYPRSDEFVKKGIPFIRCNNFKGNSIIEKDMYYITAEKHSKLLKGHVKTGDILITTRGSLGQVAIVPNKYDDANINAQIVLLRVNGEKIYNRYLMWQLKSRNVQNQIQKNKTGTALQQLPVTKLKNIELNIEENIKEQRNISQKMDIIENLIEERKKQKEELDNLIKSQFVEMFGNKENTKYKIKKLNETSKFHQGTQVPIEKQVEEFREGCVRFLRIVDYTQAPQTPRYVNTKGRMVDEKSVVIVRYGASAGFVGKGYNGMLANNLFEIVPNEDVLTKEFLYNNLKYGSFENEINQQSFGAAMPALSFNMVGNISIIVPPIELQNQFAEIVKQIDKQKFEEMIVLENELKQLQENIYNEWRKEDVKF